MKINDIIVLRQEREPLKITIWPVGYIPEANPPPTAVWPEPFPLPHTGEGHQLQRKHDKKVETQGLMTVLP